MEEVIKLCNVLATTVFIAAAIGLLYSFGLRLRYGTEGGTVSAGARIGSVACFACCVLVGLVALVLMVLG